MKDLLKKPVRKKRSPIFWRAVTLFVSLGALSLAAWVSYSPFLGTPHDVAHARKLFIGVKNSFAHNPYYWHAKRHQIPTLTPHFCKYLTLKLLQKIKRRVPLHF